MTLHQGFRLATRALVVFFLFWVIADAFNFVEDALGLIRRISLLHQTRSVMDASASSSEDLYWIRYYGLRCSVQALEIILWLGTAITLYRGGPRVRRFFVPPLESPDGATGQPLP